MTKSLTYSMTYDAPLATVTDMLADPAFREAVCEAQHATSRTVTAGVSSSGQPEMRVEYTQAVRGVPAFATKLVGDSITIVQEETWTGPSATVRMTIPGKPGSITGTVRLTEAGGTTTQQVDYDVKVSMPLVGGKLEALVADVILKALQREERAGRAWLAR